MRARTVLVLALLVAPAVAGCADPDAAEPPGPDDRRATPTDKPATIPTVTKVTQPPDFSDVGYPMAGSWRVGDQWHFYSNQSHYRVVRVVQSFHTPEGPRLVVEDLSGVVFNPPTTRAIEWVEPNTIARYNLTYTTGTLSITFTPSAPDFRFFHNGTFRYNETHFVNGGVTERATIVANSFYAGITSIPLFGKGKQNVGRVEHRVLRTDAEGRQSRDLFVNYPKTEFGYLAQYELPSNELFRIVYVRYGEYTAGEPLTWA